MSRWWYVFLSRYFNIICTYFYLCLGYDVALNIIKLLRELLDLLKGFASNLNLYSKRWKNQINEQPSISVYHTTKSAQIQMIEAPENHAKHINDLCAAIQRVIDEYRRQVNEMYPRARFGKTHKHYRTDEMKRSFKTARQPLQNVLDQIDELKNKKKQASKALETAETEYENLRLDSRTTQNKLKRADQDVQKRINELEEIEDDIVSAKEKREERKVVYRKKATEIFKRCQQLEKERLDQIGQTLVKFSQVVAVSEYSSKLGAIYEQLITNIKMEQDSQKDIDYWEHSYGVSETDSSTADENDTDDPSISEPTTTNQITTPSSKNEND
jgi:chromosome segregation ATPase